MFAVALLVRVELAFARAPLAAPGQYCQSAIVSIRRRGPGRQADTRHCPTEQERRQILRRRAKTSRNVYRREQLHTLPEESEEIMKKNFKKTTTQRIPLGIPNEHM